MNPITITLAIAMSALLVSGPVDAEPGTIVGTASGQPGSPVTIPIDYAGSGSGVVGVSGISLLITPC